MNLGKPYAVPLADGAGLSYGIRNGKMVRVVTDACALESAPAHKFPLP
ncbi:MAG: hypothetical protein U0Q18_05580 [Bryobacteraceae bacterium]